MRHGKRVAKLGRTGSHRKAMLANMVTSLFDNEVIRTTDVRAKELRRVAEHMITFAKRNDLHARRQVLRFIADKKVVAKLFDELAARFKTRNGGYTRIVKAGLRRGDGAPVSIIELVDRPGVSAGEEKPAQPAAKEEKVEAETAEDKEGEKS
jgi:large subunit ribosomal protein L17